MSTTTVMLVMVDAGPVRRWWTGPVVGMTRRRGVGRLPARLMFAGWDRRSAVRRKVPSLCPSHGLELRQCPYFKY